MSVLGKLAGQRLMRELRGWRFWAYLAALIPLAFLLILARIFLLASYLPYPHGEIVYAVLIISAACAFFTVRAVVLHLRRARHAAGLGAPPARSAYMLALGAVFSVQMVLTAVTPLAVHWVMGRHIPRKEWAQIVNRDARENLPSFPITFR